MRDLLSVAIYLDKGKKKEYTYNIPTKRGIHEKLHRLPPADLGNNGSNCPRIRRDPKLASKTRGQTTRASRFIPKYLEIEQGDAGGFLCIQKNHLVQHRS